MEREVVLGIDIGGTTTALGFVDRGGDILARAVIPTRGREPAQALLLRLGEAVAALRAEGPEIVRLVGAGIGAPNANQREGTVENPVNLGWGATTDLAGLARRQFGVPVTVGNDANAAALGELLFGSGRGMRDFILITLGTGLGSGLVVNGELVLGVGGAAGELGHTVVDPSGRQCACGKLGCLEAYVSAPGLCRTMGELLARRLEPSALRASCPDAITAVQVYEAACAGDAIALAAFDQTARVLGMKLADAAAHTGPQAIFLFGGLVAAGELLLRPLRDYFDAFLFHAYRGKVALLPSGLRAGSSALLGAAALIWKDLENGPG